MTQPWEIQIPESRPTGSPRIVPMGFIDELVEEVNPTVEDGEGAEAGGPSDIEIRATCRKLGLRPGPMP